ncbi:SH3 domain-binding protein 5 homolog isoform X1 [Centruroides sculpturatus]|uniref:SH3 domain-binding protein 5 homolog isoform X1 n=1 Tax=Centruroides sculpturatus TaxID=218467 RepID=UPI000C6CAA9F|nr:SH3 domain-binding protein 5 homolog isoform X1 [Centruroides sculpturatus]
MSEGLQEVLDPRVQDQLENLNVCTDKINQLELQLDEANAVFRSTLSESSQRLKQLAKKSGKCIEIARPYYESKEAARLAQMECQKAAVQYQRACSIHKAARETITMAEEKFLNKDNNWKFNTAWQEMVNHAAIKVLEAEALKVESEREHQKRAQMCAVAEEKVQILARQLKHAIIKSRQYFEEKTEFQKKLQDLKLRVDSLQKSVSDAKATYSKSLHNLEIISEEIHEKRRMLQPREPGVGAELEATESLLDIDKCHLIDSISQADNDSLDRESSYDSLDTTFEKMIPELNLNMFEVIRTRTLSEYSACSSTVESTACSFRCGSVEPECNSDIVHQREVSDVSKISSQIRNLSIDDSSEFVEIDLNSD